MSEFDLKVQGDDTQIRQIAKDLKAYEQKRNQVGGNPSEDRSSLEGANIGALPQLGKITGAFNASGRREVKDGQERSIQPTELRERGHYTVDNGVVAFVDPTSGDRFLMQYSDYFVEVLKTAGYTEGAVYVPKVSGKLPTITRQVQ